MKDTFWNKKKVFITGHTGFKGGWLVMWLKSLGAVVCGYSLKPEKKSLFYESNIAEGIDSNFGNILNYKKLEKKIKDFSPEIVFHLAAQPIVKKSYTHPQKTITTNVIGTFNLLESLRSCKDVRSVVIVTSDKVYENQNLIRGYNEKDSLGGHDPYSSSKACCELITNSYRSSYFSKDNKSIGIATARAGNVIGGGDYSEYRLIPDLFKSIEKNKTLILRNKNHTRPWQHVLEALRGYITLAKSLYIDSEKFSEAWNFGPRLKDCKNVKWIINKFRKNFDFEIKEVSNNKFHESKLLQLDISKAKKKLRWEPILSVVDAIDLTSEWYKKRGDGERVSKIMLYQINKYKQKLLEKNYE